MTDTQKNFDKIIRKTALVVKLVNEEVDDEPVKNEINELNDEISDLTCDILDEKNDFVELKELKNYITKVIGKDYFADKREWSYLYDSIYDVYKDMNNVLEEEMQTGLGMAQQLPTNDIYDGGVDILYIDDEGDNDMDKRLKEKKNGVIDEIQDLINDTDDLSQISFDMDESDIRSADDVIGYIEDKICEIEVIYYDNAMKILSKYDPSLRESLEYASDLGYDCKDLNSELLATIACQEWARQDLDNIRDDIEEVVEEWLEDSEDDE